MWTALVNVSRHGGDFELPTVFEWLASFHNKENRVKYADLANAAFEALHAVYDSYVDMVKPIRVGFDLKTGQYYFIRAGAKGWSYCAACYPLDVKLY